MRLGYKDYFVEFTGEEIRAVTRRLVVPKNKKGKIGIVIALKAENKEEANRIENDIVAEIREYLNKSGLGNKFYIITYPKRLSEKIHDDQTGYNFLVRSRAHFILYGSLKRRGSQNTKHYVFKLNGVVRHLPIPVVASQNIAHDFAQVLPTRASFPEGEEMLNFELTQQRISYVIKYIISLASYVSGDYDLSYKLIHELRAEIDQITQSDIPVVEELRKKIPRRALEIMHALMFKYYYQFSILRDWQYVQKVKPIVDEIQELDPEDYSAHLMSSIYKFKYIGVDDAIQELVGNMSSKDSTWCYSLGFLYAFKGDADRAWENYRRATNGISDSNVVNDTEIFISEVIDEHPDKAQLLYYRGLINYKAKPDYESANKDFRVFLEHVGSNNFPDLRLHAERYLSEIQLHLSIPSK